MSSPRSKTSLCAEASQPLTPGVSVVIPVFNEAAGLATLFERLLPVLGQLNRPSEAIFVNDGSSDDSLAVLVEAAEREPRFRIVDLTRNFGQHAAVFAGLRQARFDVVVTMDADLQNPPEEIPRLLAKIDEGFDVVGGARGKRRDSWFRKVASRFLNSWTRRITKTSLTDYGCMLRAYSGGALEALRRSSEASTFIPVLAELYATRSTEIVVEHETRVAGTSKYNPLKLLWLQFDLTTSFSLAPLRILLLVGFLLAGVSFLVASALVLGRLLFGPAWAVGGVLTVLAFVVAFVGLLLFAVGLIGEYVGRIYLEVRQRPNYLVRRVYEASDSERP